MNIDPTPAPPRRRILIVDDNETIHRDFRKTLCRTAPSTDLGDDEAALFGAAVTTASAQGLDFEIDSAMQGQEALARVEEAVREGRPYHLAFVDMRMPPGWDGVQTIERLWLADAELQVVICTAYSDYSWDQISERLGPGDRLLILKKPFDEAEVSQLAVAMTEKWRVTRQAKLKLAEMESLVAMRTAELKTASLRDRLTGLPNRELLNDRIAQAIKHRQRDPQHGFSLLFLDFDRFKVVNDSLGHEAGDKLLISIADRLTKTVRDIDTVTPARSPATAARLGGDEFILLVENLKEGHTAVRIAERLLEALSAPYHIDGHTIQSTASIGITTSDIVYSTPDQAIRDADTAMYRAKAAGKGRYVVFDQAMHAQAMARLNLENDLRAAISEGNQLFLVYQPIIDIRRGTIAGFEALCRWQHPKRGPIGPVEFIPVAEELGLINRLGAWVLEVACGQLVSWRRRDAKFHNVSMSVNLSRRQLHGRDVVAEIAGILARTCAPPASIKLEITESAIMVDPDQAIQVLEEIRKLGIGLHMDDFGTGYSSLSCLHKFPLSGLKIDQAFVLNASERRDYAAVVNAIVTLARNLNIELVAEGVEGAEQLALLEAMGCDQAQGYYFARPMPAAEAEQYVLAGKIKRAA